MGQTRHTRPSDCRWYPGAARKMDHKLSECPTVTAFWRLLTKTLHEILGPRPLQYLKCLETSLISTQIDRISHIPPIRKTAIYASKVASTVWLCVVFACSATLQVDYLTTISLSTLNRFVDRLINESETVWRVGIYRENNVYCYSARTILVYTPCVLHVHYVFRPSSSVQSSYTNRSFYLLHLSTLASVYTSGVCCLCNVLTL